MIRGGLFTRDFLAEGIQETDAWKALDSGTVAAIEQGLRKLFASIQAKKQPTEADTEKHLIWPTLEAIGWPENLIRIQQNLSAKGRNDVPDALLFLDEAAEKTAAALDPHLRFQHGACIVEAKRWARLLDREGGAKDTGVPSSQMLRYLRRVEDLAQGKLRWGMLTNGGQWRLYFQGAVSVAEDFFEIDLPAVLGLRDFDLVDRQSLAIADPAQARAHALRLFILFFGRSAFQPMDAGRTFHHLALEQGRFWEERVARDLSKTVFDEVFPQLVNALATADRRPGQDLDATYLDTLRHDALILLYRLLFVLYAEDRNLLPDESGPYAEVALTRLRLEIADRRQAGKAYTNATRVIWGRLEDIFAAIAKGNDDLGIPPYNGGLFAADRAPILGRVRLSDAVMADVLFRLSHLHIGEDRPKYINYRDLSVQQLGSVYEGLLEHGLRVTDNGSVVIDADPTARKDSGSYYTPEDLVTLVIHRAVGPLVADRREKFATLATALKSDTAPVADRLTRLAALDPASAMLDLKICDPAMGSGHFLVTLVDWLADEVLAAMDEATAQVGWAPYTSPLAARIAGIRQEIADNAEHHGWPLKQDQLDDRHIVRRMILKRVVHGVDKNRMAVELAKVSLWLHSFTVGAPLSFLDHHLRWGDSVVGAWTLPVLKLVQDRGALFRPGLMQQVARAAEGMKRVEESNDSDLSEVAASERAFDSVEQDTAPVAAFFSLLTAERMLGVLDGVPAKEPVAIPLLRKAGKSDKIIDKARADHRVWDRAVAWNTALSGAFGDPVDLAAGKAELASAKLRKAWPALPPYPPEEAGEEPALRASDRHRLIADDLLRHARDVAARHQFLHWQIAFPNIWRNLSSNTPEGGFDAIIGNPPYVRQELLGEIKPALKPLPDDPALSRPLEGDLTEKWANWRRSLLQARPGFVSFNGVADLYVYFYEQGLRLLRPGGRMGYVVTNKWLKAGYAEELRDLFAEAAWVEFIADFGHAKRFFPDADVFPSVLIVRRPNDDAPPVETGVCVIPRDAVPEKGLETVVEAATYPLPRLGFTRESWTLEPPAVMALLDKIRRNGVPLADYAGVKPLYGIKTGFNEAFLIDTTTRDRLVAEDPGCAEIIKPYLRGQDIKRWAAPDSGLYMIVMKSSADHTWPWAGEKSPDQAESIFKRTYPSLHRHFKPHEQQLRQRQDKGRFWWELRPCAYYDDFSKQKIIWPDLSWSSNFLFDSEKCYVNDLGFILPVNSNYNEILSNLNSPIIWHYLWNTTIHGKDEVLRLKSIYMERVPLSPTLSIDPEIPSAVYKARRKVLNASLNTQDWLRYEFELDKLGRTLLTPHDLDEAGFVQAVKTALPKKRRLTAADIGELQREYRETVRPAREAAAELLRLERRLSDMVNAAYGLTPEEVQLMWETAPPRMPLDPAQELQRLKHNRT